MYAVVSDGTGWKREKTRTLMRRGCRGRHQRILRDDLGCVGRALLGRLCAVGDTGQSRGSGVLRGEWVSGGKRREWQRTYLRRSRLCLGRDRIWWGGHRGRRGWRERGEQGRRGALKRGKSALLSETWGGGKWSPWCKQVAEQRDGTQLCLYRSIYTG